MQNKLSDLNNHLFEQLERLSDEDIKGDNRKEEIERAAVVSTIADKIIQNGNLTLKACQFAGEYTAQKVLIPQTMIQAPDEK